ncbi:testican-1-like [Myripristis murdjan]|uniref:testican-1-like n=1 Tax=Myripristis murdjan TaxID=586833 RepID=UPI001175D117|nr:testican-1-like [Myripristis murdjan]
MVKLDMNSDLLLKQSELSAKHDLCTKHLFNSCDSLKELGFSGSAFCWFESFCSGRSEWHGEGKCLNPSACHRVSR